MTSLIGQPLYPTNLIDLRLLHLDLIIRLFCCRLKVADLGFQLFLLPPDNTEWALVYFPETICLHPEACCTHCTVGCRGPASKV